MTLTDHYPLADLKTVYRVLHGQLLQFPSLIDSPFMADLQSTLQTAAASAGIDATDHRRWEAWLRGDPRPY